MSARIPPRDGESIRRDRPIRFTLDGKRISAFEGDTIGSAVAAADVGITGRSFKYHRPRGLFCMTGSCPNCLMQVDGIPNIRACTEPVRDGMKVERQNAWPSANRDIHGWLNQVSFMMPPGFYYKIFQHPKWAWPTVEPFIRSKAGLGKVPRAEDHEPRERITLHPDVVVIGAGAAGLAAAAEAATAGLDVVVLEQAEEPGGALLREAGTDPAGDLRDAAEAAGARLLTGTAAFGVFEGPVIAAANAAALYRIRARHIVVATGGIEQPAVFPNNDLPGVMLSSAVEILIHRFGVLPGQQAVVLTASDAGHRTARTLVEAGATVSVADLRADAPAGEGYRVASGTTILSASGRRHVTGVTVGAPGAEAGTDVACDLVVLAGFSAPSTNLLSMSGADVAFDERAQAFLPVQLPENVHAVGAVAGTTTTEAAVAQGRLAGLDAAARLGASPKDAVARIDALRAEAAIAGDPVILPPEVGSGAGKQFACLCMDVTDKELKKAVTEGFSSMELLKRYTTITMGPCQGKACMVPSQRLCARATGSTFAETKRTTSRPPWTPVELGTLAGARRTPRKETTMHDLHTGAGAEIMWAGDWRRPHHFAGPEAEVEAVRTKVGLIDVSTLGKFRVQGPGAVELLERLYPNRFAEQPIGRVRYGVMLNDEGVIVDDGAVVRVADDEFFVTVTSGNTGALERWMTWWQADWNLDVRLLNVTGAFGAVNLAGPGSREVMAEVTDADVSADALPYLGAVHMDVAGVPALVLRIGFVGELGYEIHFPSMYGEHVWQTLMEAGSDHGIRPFGLEAQRILRLEKQHILVGQDTDAESDPFEVGLGWMVKADKDDFLGKRSLADLAQTGPKERLVGFTASGAWLPPEGASIVHEGTWVGRVTSARRSAAAGCIVGLAWVPAGWAVEGTAFDIWFGESTTQGSVALQPFYDPEGAKLRS
ncbi:MAG TPA: FAD-dependent oxidoreductase [Actinomycetota bacterium]